MDEQDVAEDQSEESSEPLVNQSQYDPPKRILKHPSNQLAVINQITALSTHEEAEIADEEPGETQATRSDKVLTRYSTLAWLVRSSGLQGRLGNWIALLSPWTLEIIKCTRGEDEILGLIAVSITPRENVDSILTAIAPRKQPQQSVTAIPPTVEPSEEVLVISIDGSARVKRGGGACSAVVCRLPGWTVVAAESKYMADLTVNDAVACCWVSIDSSKWTGGP
ncbi:hypothetical protein PC116_g3568 [Phytophthora cactorum]|uniref:Uncharacterized protein n=1 Tax=Phytophthora cactorum TaxID=29920 RepID=A0A329RL78_9STRA|nr:hypothetical protein PC114_g16924 [Phytophthora cactorum]KAG4248771.1 hypothetical protein PC116_g3568 [Phytophthora cactorum]RAW24092.1 hypothetical protein PC110_g19483 [Phytophthora cactorum]